MYDCNSSFYRAERNSPFLSILPKKPLQQFSINRRVSIIRPASPNVFPQYIPRTVFDIPLKLDLYVLFVNAAIIMLTLIIFNVIVYVKNFHFHLSKCFFVKSENLIESQFILLKCTDQVKIVDAEFGPWYFQF